MDNNKKPLKLILFYAFLLIYLEIILRIFTIGAIGFRDLLIIGLFSISFGIIIFTLVDLFKSKAKYIISSIIIFLTTVLFASQLVYYKIFKMFYIIYSVGKAGQVFEFWRSS